VAAIPRQATQKTSFSDESAEVGKSPIVVHLLGREAVLFGDGSGCSTAIARIAAPTAPDDSDIGYAMSAFSPLASVSIVSPDLRAGAAFRRS
jgi:hypothetical protein